MWYGCTVFGLQFGELFIVGFVLVTVVGAPYAGALAERIALLLHLGGKEVDSAPDDPAQAEGSKERGD